MDELINISEEDFRAWCKTVGVRFDVDQDTGSISTSQSIEDMIEFALAVLDRFGPVEKS